MLPPPLRLALETITADLERRYDDAKAGADISLDDIPARLEAICYAGINLTGDDRVFLANRLDILEDILNDMALLMTAENRSKP
jgi:hypothetical protein